jgi:hypothetical protein
MKTIKTIIEEARGVYPFLLCLLGAQFIISGIQLDQPYSTLVGYAMGAFTILWALDMRAARAEAKGRLEVASQFVALLCDGKDKLIDVNFNNGASKP